MKRRRRVKRSKRIRSTPSREEWELMRQAFIEGFGSMIRLYAIDIEEDDLTKEMEEQWAIAKAAWKVDPPTRTAKRKKTALDGIPYLEPPPGFEP
jgi:hypothetical protein